MGLTLSSSYQNQDFFDPKPTFRKAGDVFAIQDYRNDSSKARGMIASSYNSQDLKEAEDKDSASTLAQTNPSSTSNSAQPNQPAAGQSNGFSMTPPKSGKNYYADKAEMKAAWNGVYDEDEYRYYVSKDKTKTGADAYHTDMAAYQANMNFAKNSAVGSHLGLINSMSHPDWQDQNYSNGKYGEIKKSNNYSVKPQDWDAQRKKYNDMHKSMGYDFT